MPQPPRHRPVRFPALAFEELEERALPSASALLTRAESIQHPREVAEIALPLTQDRIAFPASGRVLYEIQVTPTQDDGLALGSLRIVDGQGRLVGGALRPAARLRAFARLTAGEYFAQVRGLGAATGSFVLQVSLAGDVDGDRDVDGDDRHTLALAMSRRPGMGLLPPSLSDLDVSGDGRLSQIDLALAAPNLGATGTTVTFAVTNATGQFSDAQVFIVFYGQDSAGAWFYLDASGQKHATSGLASVPAFTLAQIPNGLEVSNATRLSGRILIGAGAAPVAPIVNPQGAVAAPNPGNLTDPNNNLYVEFLEYTLIGTQDNGGTANLNIDTSQVDAFGFPITLQTTPGDGASPNGVGINLTRTAVIDAFRAYAQGTPFDACLTTSAAGAHGLYRILSPQDVLQLNPGLPLGGYFNAMIDQFFQLYQTNTLSLTHEGITYQGSVVQIQREGNTYTALQLTGGGDTFDIFYPFFTTNTNGYAPRFAMAPPPSWIVSAGKQNVPASAMVFGNHGVFADNGGQFPSDGRRSTILGNLENQIVSALSRGIALNPVAEWSDFTKFYPAGGTWNRYAAFWHQPSISIGGKAYGFPFDDQGGHSSDLSVNNPERTTITLGRWA